MEYSFGEIVDMTARTSQMLFDVAEFEDCETLEDYEEAVLRLRQKMLITAAKTTNNLRETQYI
ncbi:MAG: hypothetical protein LBN43_07730 [Oscillospiraceae bacterium]|jgi:hypothetical protein|nr:hypothetical protein [Oscillospiraceae bacterium]